MEDREIVQKIMSFSRWHYQFDLNGHLTPIYDKRLINRHRQRRKYFMEPVVQLFGGSLSGKRVLDLGCNAGFWSLCSIEAGCDFVLGVDGRRMHIEQANFVFEVNEIAKSRYEFVCKNIFEMDFERFEAFDIVLCLGLLYHINKPIVLMEKIAHSNSDILIIDTALVPKPGSHFAIFRDALDDPRMAVDYELALHPTRGAVFDIVRQFGYSAIVLKPRFQGYTGAVDYWLGLRRAFVCAKETDLSDFPAETESISLYTRCRDVSVMLASKLIRFGRKLVHPLRESGKAPESEPPRPQGRASRARSGKQNASQ